MCHTLNRSMDITSLQEWSSKNKSGSAGLKALMALTHDSHRVHALDGQPVIGHTDQDDLGAVLIRIRLLDLGEELYCLGLLYGDAASKPMAGGCGRLLSLAPLVLPCPGM